MTDKINFKLEYNGETYRFASSFRGEQLFRVVTGHVASIVKEKGCELFWKDEDCNIVLESAADLSTAIDYAMYTRKSPSKTPRVHLTIESQREEEVQEQPASAAEVAAPVAEIQEEPTVDAVAEALEDAVTFPLFDEDEKQQQHRQKVLADLAQSWAAINENPFTLEMRKRGAEVISHPTLARTARVSRYGRKHRPTKANYKNAALVLQKMFGGRTGSDEEKAFDTAISNFSSQIVAAMKAKISPQEIRASNVAYLERMGIADVIANKDCCEEDSVCMDEEEAAAPQLEEKQVEMKMVSGQPTPADEPVQLAELAPATMQLLKAASEQPEPQVVQPAAAAMQQVQPDHEAAEPSADFIARARELKIREKALELKEETFVRKIAIFQVKMEEVEQKFAALGKKVEEIEEKMDTEYLASRMDEMEERLKKVEETIDEDDMVIM